METTVNVTVGIAASVEPIVTPTMLDVARKLNLPHIEHCQGDRAKRRKTLCNEMQHHML
jgi:hypothetical protein